MSTHRRNRLLMLMAVLVGVATVSVAYAAEVAQAISNTITIEPKIELGSIISMMMIAGGGISVWVKINRSDARQEEKLRGLASSLEDARRDHRALRDLVNQILLGNRQGP